MAQRGVKEVLFVGPANLGSAACDPFNAIATRMRLPWKGRCVVAASIDEQVSASRVVVLHAGEPPVLDESTREKTEVWRIDDLARIEREISGLVARLLGGGQREEPPETQKTEPKKENKPKKKPVVRVGRETKGRRGKGVTTVTDVPLGEAELLDLAALLKNRCGTGGTVKDGVIEIQGDQRDRLAVELEKLGYQVKRVGG
jgi:translation initiation factor 1